MVATDRSLSASAWKRRSVQSTHTTGRGLASLAGGGWRAADVFHDGSTGSCRERAVDHRERTIHRDWASKPARRACLWTAGRAPSDLSEQGETGGDGSALAPDERGKKAARRLELDRLSAQRCGLR